MDIIFFCRILRGPEQRSHRFDQS